MSHPGNHNAARRSGVRELVFRDGVVACEEAETLFQLNEACAEQVHRVA